jgi:hypothetical protein
VTDVEFRWEGVEIRTPGQLVKALRALTDEVQARRFLAVARAAWGDKADANVAYHTGYMDRDEGQRVLGWLGLQHPLIGDLTELTSGELFTLGGSFTQHKMAGHSDAEAASLARDDVLAMRRVREEGQ